MPRLPSFAVLFVLVFIVLSLGSVAKMRTPASHDSERWELTILDAQPPGETETAGTAVGDIYGDGKKEILIGGDGTLLWYQPSTSSKGIISHGHFNVGLGLGDMDGDGIKEVIVGRELPKVEKAPEQYGLYLFKPGKTLDQPWTETTIDPHTTGSPHDIVLADLDGDGKLEVVVNALSDTPGLFIYKPDSDPSKPWHKQAVQTGHFAEGTAVGDIDGDGKPDIQSGPYWFSQPAEGAFSGQTWSMHTIAPGFRESCRSALVDLNGDGKLDAVIAESEYPDGHLSWFENRLAQDPKFPWLEHRLEAPLNFAHSLQAWRNAQTGQINVLVGEMNQGGWSAPYNYDARLIRYAFSKRGDLVERQILYRGEGTHEAVVADIDGDGIPEIIGHSAQVKDKAGFTGWVQIFKQVSGPPPLPEFHHQFLDRDKPVTCTDVVTADVDGDKLPDVICGSWWYHNPTWERHQIPGIYQVLNAYDIDGCGRKELIVMKQRPGVTHWYDKLSANLWWIKPIDPLHDRWEAHEIGTGSGDWPHGSAIGPLLPAKRVALVAGYHNRTHPEIFEMPADPTAPWPKRVLAEIPYGEEIVPYDLDGDGKLDLVAGPWWLENRGDGQFTPHLLAEGFGGVARIAVADINGDGKPDVVVSEEDLSYQTHESYLARVAWLENNGDPRNGTFKVHVVDRIRCPHSLSVADIDGDGQLEIIAAEHDPFKPYRSRSRLFVYKKSEKYGFAWTRYTIDDRFEQHDGAKVFEVSPGKMAIVGHGWAESRYLHLWLPN